ncbi:hypothetical protein VPJ68_19180, partial [Parabacteroides distasonis]
MTVLPSGIPNWRPISAAVAGESPVTIITLTLASWEQRWMAAATSLRRGSLMAAMAQSTGCSPLRCQAK